MAVVGAVMIPAFLAGCEGNTRAVFTKPELISYERLAVLGLDPEQEQIFMAAYVKTFVQAITFVERGGWPKSSASRTASRPAQRQHAPASAISALGVVLVPITTGWIARAN